MGVALCTGEWVCWLTLFICVFQYHSASGTTLQVVLKQEMGKPATFTSKGKVGWGWKGAPHKKTFLHQAAHISQKKEANFTKTQSQM